MLLLKAEPEKVRNEEHDSTDLWRCLEVAAAEGVTSSDLPTDPVIGDLGASSARSSDEADGRSRRSRRN